MRKAGLPPHVPGEPLRLIWVPAGPTLHVLFLGPIRGLNMHYHQGRPLPCLGEASCPPDRHRAMPVWYGYAPVELFRPESLLWVPYVLEITAHLETRLAGRTLRGEVWALCRRETTKRKSAVEGELKDRFDEAEISPCFEIKSVLEAWFREENLPLGAVNPVTPKTYLPSAVRRPPLIDPVPAPAEPRQYSGKRIQDLEAERKAREKDEKEQGAAELNGHGPGA